MHVLGCDPSLRDYGWIVIDMEEDGPDQILGSGRIKTDSDTLFVRRYMRIREEISEVLDWYSPAYAGVECPPPRASMSAALYPLYILTSEALFNHRTPFCIMRPQTLKMFAREILNESGNAKMEKQDMVEAAKKKIGGYKGRMNHNIADAFMAAYYGGRLKKVLEEELDEGDLTEKEQQKFTKTVKSRKTGRIRKEGMKWGEGESHFALDDDKYDHLYESQENLI